MDFLLFILEVVCVAVLLILALVGFIFIQIKARPVWRLLSLVVVLVACCWLSAFFTHLYLSEEYADTYERGVREFVQAIDQMDLNGRPNDVHQSYQKFLDVYFLSIDKRAVTNFDQFVLDTSVWAQKQTNGTSVPKDLSDATNDTLLAGEHQE
jgi:energy-coupling factor transporter transmembrane protein EcfT